MAKKKYRRYGWFLMGVATGLVLASPRMRRKAKDLLRKGFKEIVIFKTKLEKAVAVSGEDLEDFIAEVKAEQEASAAHPGGSAEPAPGSDVRLS